MIKNNFHPNYRPDIDGLRAFAIISVVIFHAFPSALRGGFAGVDIFFVISGYLINTIIFKSAEQGTFSFLQFYIKRIKRIFPVLIVVLLCCYVFGWFSLYPPEYATLGKHIASSSAFISNFILWSESGYFDAASLTKPLLHLWSLAIEEQFYVLWPIIVITLFKLRINLLFANILIVVSSFLYGIYLINTDSVAAFYSPLARFWEIGIGSMLAWTSFKSNKVMSSSGANFISILGIFSIVFAVIYLREKMSFPGYLALLPTIGAALLIKAGPEAFINKKFLANKFMVWVGLISYPLYLWHWPLLTYINTSSDQFILSHIQLSKFIVVILSTVLAWTSYKVLETPIRNVKKDKLLAAFIVVLMAVVGCTGLYTFKNAGLVFRIPMEFRDLGAITNPYSFFQFGENVRQNICHMTDDQHGERKEECFGKKRPLLMIWGDSYAAALYPGIKLLSEKYNIGITQITGGNAPPFFVADKKAADGKSLLDDNNYAVSVILEEKPQLILLSWMVTGSNAYGTPQETIEALKYTIQKTREASPLSKIILVGPVPHWEKALSTKILDYLKDKPLGTDPGDYMSYGLVAGFDEWDKYLSNESTKLGIKYISAYKALCNEHGCKIRTGKGALNLTAVDWGHLTKAGSEYLVSLVSSDILSEMQIEASK